VYFRASKCKRVIQYGEKKRCPEYDLRNCDNPDHVTSCPVISNPFKSPCYRWICRKLEEGSTEVEEGQTSTKLDEVTLITFFSLIWSSLVKFSN
jgi:hypothetical protein